MTQRVSEGKRAGRKRTGWLGRAFQIALVIKGVDGVLEILGGALLALTGPRSLHQFIVLLTQYELSEDPHDLIARFLLHVTQQLSASKAFGVYYLLSHGVVKVLLALGVLRQQLWAYPTIIGCLLFLILCQGYRYIFHPSLALLLLTLLDGCIVGLTWREYRKMEQMS